MIKHRYKLEAYPFEVNPSIRFILKLPKHAAVISVESVLGQPQISAMINPNEKEMVDRTFCAYHTGDDITTEKGYLKPIGRYLEDYFHKKTGGETRYVYIFELQL